MDDIPGALTPSLPDLFHDSVDCAPADKALYRKNIGIGVYLLKARHDVRKEITHLSTKVESPTADDMRKLIHVNRYLTQTAGLGPTYYTEEVVRLYGHVDASYGVHTNGHSQTGF
jgi:hypothetical protein